jgi:hypothetical protein
MLISKTEFINEPKRVYLPLKKLTLNEGQYIKDSWHHALISYLQLDVKYNHQHADIELEEEIIKDIIQFYGIYPPLSYPYHKKFKNMYKSSSSYNEQ